MNTNEKKIPLWVALAILGFFAAAFILQVVLWGSPNVHMTLIFSSAFAAILLMTQGVPFSKVEEGIIHGNKIATVSMMILMFVGIMIPAWIGAGTIPALIYYGLKIISPSIFLAACVFICAVSCLATGTSWGTAATFGVAMMGIGQGLGVPAAWTAGAVVSGALFGDTLSPVSDFANLASGTCEINLFRHIKSMFCVTIPSFVLALLIGLVMSLKFSQNTYDPTQVQTLMDGIAESFKITPLYAIVSLIPMLMILIMGYKKVNSMATIVASSLVAMVIAMVMQGYNLNDMMTFMNSGFSIDTGRDDLNNLFNRGGLQSMMYTVSIGYLGLSFSGILEKCGVMDTLLASADKFTNTARKLVVSQAVTGCLTAVISASDYVAIMIPGRLFAKGYDNLGISRTVLSRTTVTCGAVFGWIFPWTVGGVYISGVLGVSTFAFAPFAFYIFAILLLNVAYGIFGVFMPKASEEELAERQARETA